MKRKRALVSLTCTAALVLLLADSGPAMAAEAGAHTPTTPATHAVAIEAMQFSPDSLAVSVGDTVVWVNKDPFPHTVTAKDGGFDSHEIAPGKSWRYQMRKAGVFPYVCTLHTTMKGTLQAR